VLLLLLLLLFAAARCGLRRVNPTILVPRAALLQYRGASIKRTVGFYV
jgi:hypothetical protein